MKFAAILLTFSAHVSAATIKQQLNHNAVEEPNLHQLAQIVSEKQKIFAQVEDPNSTVKTDMEIIQHTLGYGADQWLN